MSDPKSWTQIFVFSALNGIFAAGALVAMTTLAPDLIRWAPFLSAWQEIISVTCLVLLARISWKHWVDPTL